ncbi:MAG: SDR family oxidoreductase [Beijerinckiaceae bacterium]
MSAPELARGVAIVSGGTSGIGLACASLLARRGHPVALIARDSSRLESARRDLLALGSPGVFTFSLDVTDPGACEKCVAQIITGEHKIDWLITSAGDVEPGLFAALDVAAYRRQMEANFFGSVNLAVPVGRHMVAQRSGRIVLISSAAAFIGIAGYSAYGASKFAVRGLGESLRVELAPYGVTCGVAFPPDTDTPQLARDHASRPPVTGKIAASGGLMSAQAVAERIVAQALKGRFLLAPSLLTQALGWMHSLYRPILMKKQERLLRRALAGKDQSPS